MRHISSFLLAVFARLRRQRPVRAGCVAIETLTEDPQVLRGLIQQATDAGLIREISEVWVNGRRLPVVGR
jgi:hypothetical protein